MNTAKDVGRCETFEFGDLLRLEGRPEWGTGAVTKVEHVPVDGKATQRLTIRFPNAGLKTLNAAVARLIRVDAPSPTTDGPTDRISGIDRIAEDELMAPLASRKLQEVMLAIPERCRDPFRSVESRIQSALELYRYDNGGRGLVDWAVAQTGLDDPLSRFNRHELEAHFSRWSSERDLHLNKLLREAREAGLNPEPLLAKAPTAARIAARRGR